MPIVRRLGVIAASALAIVAVAAVAAVGARDAYYWDRPLPGVELREAQLQTPVRVVVGDREYHVKPGEALRLDGTATEQALWDAGRTSFTGRIRQLVDPSPPTLVVDPVLVARPEAEQIAEEVSASLPKPRRAQVVAHSDFRIIPSRPGDAVDPGRLAAALATGVPDRRADGLARADARRAGADDGRRRGGGRGGEALIDEPVTLEFKGEDVGTLAPARLAKLLRFRPVRERFGVSFHPSGWPRRWSRC